MSEFAIPSVIVDADFLQEAQEASSFLLKVPEHAKVTAKGTRIWTEMFNVIESAMGWVENNPERIEVIVKFKVADESVDTTNVGQGFRARYLLNPSKMKEKGSKERTMSLMSMNRLGTLLRAAGQLEEGESSTQIDLKDFFTGETPPIQGAKVYALLKDYKDKEGVRRQDILQFDDLAAGSPADG